MEAQFAEYYDAFFPYKQWFQWLNHSTVPSPDFTHREFAFSIAGKDDSDIYIRYQSFSDEDGFRKKVQQLIPKRFEIGAVYSVKPKDHRIVAKDKYQALSKELVFDIDLSDYDAYRTCCQGKQVCQKCWQFVAAAVEVLNVAFEQDFGFTNVIWAFSGRRGIHAWVCDARARALDDSQRTALLEYLNVTGRFDKGKMVVPRPWHPHIKRSFDLLLPFFARNILGEQDPWRTPEQAAFLIERLGPAGDEIVNALKQKWQSREISSRERWDDINTVGEKLKLPTASKQALLEQKQNIILEYLYPKLDVHVSTARGHLLKSPFCVHPDTGKVCVPLTAEMVSTLDPDTVPNLDKLLAELHSGAAVGHGLLEPYLAVFRRFVADLRRPAKRPADTLDF